MITTYTMADGDAHFAGADDTETLAWFAATFGEGYGAHHGATVNAGPFPTVCIRATDAAGSSARLFISQQVGAWVSVSPPPAMIAARAAAMDRHPAGRGRA
jgi:hypothetical protein